MPTGRVNLALGAGRLAWSPTWTRVDSIDNLVSGFDISRGKQTEVDSTDTSTATVYVNDRGGYFDPANGGSAFAGYLGKQIVLGVRDPVTSAWVQQFRGWVDSADFVVNPATRNGVSIVSNVQLHCVDIFGLLSRLQMDVSEVAGNRVFGNNVPPGNEGVVFYEDSDPGDGSGFDNRIIQILDDCGLTTDWYVVFTGNVDLLEGLYDVGDSPMIALEQAVSAEMPGLAMHCSDKQGRYCARGRRHRFEPDAVAADAGSATWNFRRWKAGDGAAILLDGARAQIRPPLGWTLAEEKIRNVGYAYPKLTQVAGKWVAFPDKLKPGQVYAVGGVNPVDRRVWSAENLLVKAGTTTGLTGAAEAKLYGQFWATVLAQPRTRVDAVTLKSLNPTDPRAAATWGLMLGAEISDVLDLRHGVAGGVGISEEFYVEGSQMQVRNLGPAFDSVTVTLNLSPAAYYADPMGLLG